MWLVATALTATAHSRRGGQFFWTARSRRFIHSISPDPVLSQHLQLPFDESLFSFLEPSGTFSSSSASHTSLSPGVYG